jgi:hypothetical protein
MANTATTARLATQLRGAQLMSMTAVKLQVMPELLFRKVATEVADAPVLQSAPERTTTAIQGTGSQLWYLPQAVVARRSPTSRSPYVHLDLVEGAHVLNVRFSLVRAGGVAAAAQPLPLSNPTVELHSPGTGNTLTFTTVAEIPPGEDESGVVQHLDCHTNVDLNQAMSMMDGDPNCRFRVKAEARYRLQEPSEPKRPSKPKQGKRRDHRLKKIKGRDHRLRQPVKPAIANSSVEKPVVGFHLNPSMLAQVVGTDVRAEAVAAETHRAGAVTSKVIDIAASGELGSGHFRRDIADNWAVYARVTSGVGPGTAAAWSQTTDGWFREAPVPGQYHVVPDEYRLAFDVDSGLPAMTALIVAEDALADPGEGATADGEGEAQSRPRTFSQAYRMRVRFGVVPWIDVDRLDALRTQIKKTTHVAHPELVLGGVAEASYEISPMYAEMGGEVLGDSEGVMAVDPSGFELVLDCSSQFYNSLETQLVAEGFDGTVRLSLPMGDGADQGQVDVPASLRLDLPDDAFLTVEMVPPELADGDAPDPNAPVRAVVRNPSPFPVTVERVRAYLLEIHPEVSQPLRAVSAQASPASLALAPAGDGSSVELELAPSSPAEAAFTGLATSLAGVHVEIDPAALLEKAREMGGSRDVQTSVELRCYPLEHPDVLPEEFKAQGLYGIEVQLRRGEASPVTAFLTLDQPRTDVQVAFTLQDIVAGATPEQPTFEWRRRNLIGAGTSEWSEWETITGRQLFVQPAETAA